MPKLKKFVKPLLIATPLVWLLAQCSVGNLLSIAIGKKIWLSNDSSDSTDLRNQVRQMLPIGSSITDAKWLLELNGFECEYMKSSTSASVWDTKKTSKDGDVLSCGCRQTYIVCVINHGVGVHYINDKVTSADASIGSYCL